MNRSDRIITISIRFIGKSTNKEDTQMFSNMVEVLNIENGSNVKISR